MLFFTQSSGLGIQWEVSLLIPDLVRSGLRTGGCVDIVQVPLVGRLDLDYSPFSCRG